MLRKVLFILAFLVGCATPDNWKPEDHQRMMMRCYVMCKKSGAESYDSWTAECTCLQKTKK